MSCQTETEIGSAGEQPIRVRFDDRRKSKGSKGCQIGIPLTFSAPSMASIFDGSSPLWGLSVANH